jgi:hypothetical protein
MKIKLHKVPLALFVKDQDCVWNVLVHFAQTQLNCKRDYSSEDYVLRSSLTSKKMFSLCCNFHTFVWFEGQVIRFANLNKFESKLLIQKLASYTKLHNEKCTLILSNKVLDAYKECQLIRMYDQEIMVPSQCVNHDRILEN